MRAGPRQIDTKRRDVVGRLIEYLDDEYAYDVAGAKSGFRLHVNTFDRAVPMIFCDNREMQELFHLSAEYFNPKTAGRGFTPDILDNPLRVSLMLPNDESENKRAIQFQKLRMLSREEARAVCRPWSPFVVESTLFWPEEQETCRIYLAWRHGMFLPCAGAGRYHLAPGAEHDTYMDSPIKGAISLQLTEETLWRVHFKKHGRPGVLLPTHPHIARQMFQHRDVPQGKTRRAALLNWIEGHHRTPTTDRMSDLERAALAVYVKGHFRGGRTFTWLGLECEISPSASDLKKAEREDLLSEWRHIGALIDMPPLHPVAV